MYAVCVDWQSADVLFKAILVVAAKSEAIDTSTLTVSAVRQRTIDKMRLRKLEPKTQSGYLRAVKRFAVYLGRSPITATIDDFQHYQLHLVKTLV